MDWGEAAVIHHGVERKVQLFCMKLCHSHVVFVRAYERANLESFLDGHVRAFAFFGGVPKRIAYDNLKSAVEGSKGDRRIYWVVWMTCEWRRFLSYPIYAPVPFIRSRNLQNLPQYVNIGSCPRNTPPRNTPSPEYPRVRVPGIRCR